MKEPISPCECSLDDHWDSLGELTVVVFTRDRSREVTRLLSSLTGVPCRVLVYDNGSQPVTPAGVLISPWALGRELASSGFGLEDPLRLFGG